MTGNTDTAGWLHAKEQTTHPTAVPGSHPWHVIIVHLATGTNTEEARQGSTNRWAHVCTTLHKGLRMPSLTCHILQPAPITAEPHTRTAPPTGVWTYTRTLHRGAFEAHHLQQPNLVHTPHHHTQKGYTLWWQHPAPEGALEPPADQHGLSLDLTAIARAVATMAQQFEAPPKWAPSVIKETASRHNAALAHFRGRPNHPPLPDPDLPTHDAWAVHILVHHDVATKAGGATACITKQLPSTTLHYDIPPPNLIITHKTGRDHYYLHATHEPSPINIYTFTTYPGLRPPRHHPGQESKHPLHVTPAPHKRSSTTRPLPPKEPPSTHPEDEPRHNSKTACSHALPLDPPLSRRPPTKAPWRC